MLNQSPLLTSLFWFAKRLENPAVMEGVVGMGSVCHAFELKASFTSFDEDFEMRTLQFCTNLCTVWKDPERTYIRLQLITCNSGQFQAIFLLCLPLLAIKAGHWLWASLRRPLWWDSQAGEVGNGNFRAEEIPKQEKKSRYNWTVPCR